MGNDEQDKLWKRATQLAGVVLLGIGGITAMAVGETDIASFCFGAIAGYVLKNGYNAVKKG